MPRIARLLEIVWLVSSHPKQWSRDRLAVEFGVSVRTINEDLRVLQDELRLVINNARGEGYYFSSIPQLPSVAYTLPEALALILAAHSARQVGGVSQRDLASAIARLSSVMPAELRAMLDRFGGSEDGPPESPHRETMLALLSQALSLQRTVQISYLAASAASDMTVREVEPYEVVRYGRSWHLVAFCRMREDFRTFKIDRIQSADILADTFQRQEEFDAEEFLNEGWGLIRGVDQPVEEVVLLFRQPSAIWVAEEEWHSSQQVEHRPDGTILFRVLIRITPEFQRWVFRYGRDVEVVQPQHLRDWIREEAQAVLSASRLQIP